MVAMVAIGLAQAAKFLIPALVQPPQATGLGTTVLQRACGRGAGMAGAEPAQMACRDGISVRVSGRQAGRRRRAGRVTERVRQAERQGLTSMLFLVA